MQGQIDILSERPIPIKAFAQEVPGTKGAIHWMTLGRWCRPPGLHGVVLESVIIGNQRCVTRESYARFVEAVTRARNGNRPAMAISGRTRREKNKAVRDAIADLVKAGA